MPSRRSSGELSAKPATVSTALKTQQAMSAVFIAVFIRVMRFAPNSFEMTTELPTFIPVPNASRIVVIGYDAPTALRALSPMNLPAMTVSAML